MVVEERRKFDGGFVVSLAAMSRQPPKGDQGHRATHKSYKNTKRYRNKIYSDVLYFHGSIRLFASPIRPYHRKGLQVLKTPSIIDHRQPPDPLRKKKNITSRTAS